MLRSLRSALCFLFHVCVGQAISHLTSPFSFLFLFFSVDLHAACQRTTSGEKQSRGLGCRLDRVTCSDCEGHSSEALLRFQGDGQHVLQELRALVLLGQHVKKHLLMSARLT